ISSVVSPGATSSHANTVAGASGFSPTAGFDAVQASGCTSCAVSVDNSDYWYPSLFYINPNNTYTYIPAGITTFYETRGNLYNHEFPRWFGMIAGNYTRRGQGRTQVERAVGWICIGRENPGNADGAGIPRDCERDVRAQVQFPVCADGRGFAGDQSHVSYAYNNDGTIAFDGGDCPSTHPTRLVKIFIEVLFHAGDLNCYPFHANRDEPRFVLSTGDTMGLSFHVVKEKHLEELKRCCVEA
ncbi:hypothetical protein DFJ73DRAFT_631962, partial [Zopfochytrium polystomum]